MLTLKGIEGLHHDDATAGVTLVLEEDTEVRSKVRVRFDDKGTHIDVIEVARAPAGFDAEERSARFLGRGFYHHIAPVDGG